MDSKFDKIINEYVLGTQDAQSQPTASLSPFAGGSFNRPPDTGANMGHTKNLKKALKRDKIRRKYNEKQIRKSTESI